jgi:DNA-binding MarR family transcriptional regulator/GNAT superfamily N-acetyltransferase
MLDPITRLRRFNRAVTREVGALDLSYLGRGRPLGVARVLQRVTPQGTDVAEIRSHLDLDSGLTSRILRGLEREGLITVTPDPADRRRRVARLTPAGVEEMAAYEALGIARARQTLARAPHQSAALLAAMDLIATVLNQSQTEIRPADPDDPAAIACLALYFRILCDKIPGVTPDLFPLPDPHAETYRPPNGAFLIAWSDDMPIGCVSLRRLDAETGEVKRLWVSPDARGQGLARRLMRAIEAEARALGYKALKLDTNAALPEAIALYRTEGWADIAPYSPFPSTHWFAKTL